MNTMSAKYRWLIALAALLSFTNGHSNSLQNNTLISACKAQVIQAPMCKHNGNIAIEFNGNKIISRNIIQDVIDHCASNDDLSIIFARQKISELYACAGYITSGANLKQNEQGVYSYQIQEGKISKENITVKDENNNDIDQKTEAQIIVAILGNQPSPILDINDLRRRLERLKLGGQLQGINTTVAPNPDKQGEVSIHIKAKPGKKTSWVVALDNQQPKSTGETQLTLSGNRHGIRSIFDNMGASVSISEGSKGLSVTYSDSPSDTSSWSVSADRKESSIITEPLNILDIKGVSTKLSFNYDHHLRNTLTTHDKTSTSEKLDWSSKAELIRTENYLLDRAFSFSEGEVEGKAGITSLQTGVSWEKKERSDTDNYALAASAGVDIGVEVFGATKHFAESAGSDYKIAKVSAGHRRAIGEHGNLLLSLNGQYSTDKLLAVKKVGLGGSGSVRGVDKNVTSFDSGVALTAEVSTLLPKLSKAPFKVESVYDGNLYASTFADYALGKDNRTGKKQSIGSLGVGTTWYLNKNTKLTASWAKPVSFTGFDSQQKAQLDDGKLDFSLVIQGGK